MAHKTWKRNYLKNETLSSGDPEIKPPNFIWNFDFLRLPYYIDVYVSVVFWLAPNVKVLEKAIQSFVF